MTGVLRRWHIFSDDTIYNDYIRRAKYYRNIYDPSTGFMRPRINGIWLTHSIE